MDEDGYPSEEFLTCVENFDCMKDDVRILIDALEREWWSADWGFKRSVSDDGELMIELHTGGWSGNEEILGALKKNKWFYMFYWDMSRRGGHEYFHFSKLKSWGGGDSHE